MALTPILTISQKVYPIVEIFGPTIQGEGALTGTVSHFIRFGGCDFSCSWCDSAHAVLPENVRAARKMRTSDIMATINALPPAEWVTLSGGNPALHDLTRLVSSLHQSHYMVAVETQGSKWHEWLGAVDILTVSPKPPSSGMQNEYLKTFLGRAQGYHEPFGFQCCASMVLKVPVYDEVDLDWALNLHKTYNDIPFYLSIVTEMGGLFGDFADGRIDVAGTLLARYTRITEALLTRGVTDVRIIPQLHYLLWGNRTGV